MSHWNFFVMRVINPCFTKRILILAERWQLNDKRQIILITRTLWKPSLLPPTSDNDPNKNSDYWSHSCLVQSSIAGAVRQASVTKKLYNTLHVQSMINKGHSLPSTVVSSMKTFTIAYNVLINAMPVKHGNKHWQHKVWQYTQYNITWTMTTHTDNTHSITTLEHWQHTLYNITWTLTTHKGRQHTHYKNTWTLTRHKVIQHTYYNKTWTQTAHKLTQNGNMVPVFST